MPHFKDTNNGLFWLDDADVSRWRKPGWQQITEAEAEAIRAANAPAPDRRGEIGARLAQIDQQSIRPARAVAAALATGRAAPAPDAQRLVELESQAVALRAELAAQPQASTP